MLNVNNKILWLADFNLDDAPGGAQRSDQLIIDQGRILGYNITKFTNNTFPPATNIHNYDVLVTSNLHALTVKNPGLLNQIFTHKYHVRIEHDSNDYLSQDDRIKLFSNCKKTFLLSDFHYDFFRNFYGDIFKNVEIIYDPIFGDDFKDLKNQREDKILCVGYLHYLKGSYEFFDYVLTNPDKKFVVAGWPSNHCLNYMLQTIKNVEYLGTLDYSKMPEIYNKYKYLYYSPNLNEPFCRSVAEAILCGMQLLTNNPKQIGCIREIEKVGIDQFREMCSKAAIKFWQSI